MKKILLLLSLLSTPIFAQTENLTPEQKNNLHQVINSLNEKDKHALNIQYAYGSGELTNNWHFMYGPIGKNYPIKTLQLQASTTNGGAVFTCKNDGSISLNFTLLVYNKPKVGTIQNINLRIGNTIHELPTLVQNVNKDNDYVNYQSDGSNVLGILTVINKLTYHKDSNSDIVFKTDNRTLSFPAPNVDDDSKATIVLCGKWYNNSLKESKELK